MNKMTRNEAAQYLGVSSQTISNLVNRGVLSGYNDKTARRFYVNKDDVEKYESDYKFISSQETSIFKLKQSLKEEIASVRESLLEIRSTRSGMLSVMRDKYSSKILQAIFGKSPTDYQKALISFTEGVKYDDLPYIGHLTYERIREILNKEVKRTIPLIESFIKTSENIIDLESDKKSLMSENARLIDENKVLLKENEAFSSIAQEKYFLECIVKHKHSKNLYKIFSESNIKTFKEITSLTEEDLIKKYRITRGVRLFIKNFLKDYGYELKQQ